MGCFQDIIVSLCYSFTLGFTFKTKIVLFAVQNERKIFLVGGYKKLFLKPISLLAIQNKMKNFLVGVGVIKYFSSNLYSLLVIFHIVFK